MIDYAPTKLDPSEGNYSPANINDYSDKEKSFWLRLIVEYEVYDLQSWNRKYKSYKSLRLLDFFNDLLSDLLLRLDLHLNLDEVSVAKSIDEVDI